MFNLNKKTDKKLLNPGWGGVREKSGRKCTWNHKETTTIRIPKAFEQEVMRYARYLDAELNLDNETDSSTGGNSSFIESNFPIIDTIDDDFDYETDSSFGTIQGMEDYSYLEIETESLLKISIYASVHECDIPGLERL
jgi:hypothetical protein